MMTWLEEPHRGARDLDLLGFGDPDPDQLVEVFRRVMATEEDDGLVFDTDALRSLPIRADMAYGGVRLRTTATLDGAHIPIAIDVGFGDALELGAVVIDYPVLLDMPPPRLRAYARETVIAEKFQAMVALGRAKQPHEGLLRHPGAVAPVRVRPRAARAGDFSALREAGDWGSGPTARGVFGRVRKRRGQAGAMARLFG